MTGVADLRQALDHLDRIQQALGEISRRDDDARAKDLIDGRRRLTDQMAIVAQTGEALFARHDPDLAREFRRRFGAMRSGAAALRADWPAVKVRDDATGSYARAVAAVRDADNDCMTWVRTALSRLERALER